VPDDIENASLDPSLERWAQGVRYALADAEPDVTVGMVRGHILASSSEAILAALVLAHETLNP
jgi:hypothetical protein